VGLINEVQVGRYNATLFKLLSMKEGAPAPTLAPELVASVILEADRPEFHFLGGSHLGIGQADQAAGGAGVSSWVMLHNPVGSNALVIVEEIRPVEPGGTSIGGSIRLVDTSSGALGTNTNNAIWRDTRGAGNPGANQGLVAETRVLTVTPGAGNSLIIPFRLQAGVQAIFTLRLVLSPGRAVAVTPDVSNQRIAASWSWYERPLEPSEAR
jgi:hypothetical protein